MFGEMKQTKKEKRKRKEKNMPKTRDKSMIPIPKGLKDLIMFVIHIAILLIFPLYYRIGI